MVVLYEVVQISGVTELWGRVRVAPVLEVVPDMRAGEVDGPAGSIGEVTRVGGMNLQWTSGGSSLQQTYSKKHATKSQPKHEKRSVRDHRHTLISKKTSGEHAVWKAK